MIEEIIEAIWWFLNKFIALLGENGSHDTGVSKSGT